MTVQPERIDFDKKQKDSVGVFFQEANVLFLNQKSWKSSKQIIHTLIMICLELNQKCGVLDRIWTVFISGAFLFLFFF